MIDVERMVCKLQHRLSNLKNILSTHCVNGKIVKFLLM